MEKPRPDAIARHVTTSALPRRRVRGVSLLQVLISIFKYLDDLIGLILEFAPAFTHIDNREH